MRHGAHSNQTVAQLSSDLNRCCVSAVASSATAQCPRTSAVEHRAQSSPAARSDALDRSTFSGPLYLRLRSTLARPNAGGSASLHPASPLQLRKSERKRRQRPWTVAPSVAASSRMRLLVIPPSADNDGQRSPLHADLGLPLATRALRQALCSSQSRKHSTGAHRVGQPSAGGCEQ